MYFTEKQLRIMEFIQQFRAERGISPTLEEIAEYFGVTKITIYEHINQLERKGALKREKFRARSIELLVPVEERGSRFSLPLMGNLRAGSPIEAPQERENFNIAEFLPVGKRYFVLRVTDDSLDAARIADGDYVIVEKRQEARDGETVVAILKSGEATIRRYHNGNGDKYLTPFGVSEDEMTKLGEVEIRGVVVGVLRHFGNGTSSQTVGNGTAPAAV
jgi:repressor LexA